MAEELLSLYLDELPMICIFFSVEYFYESGLLFVCLQLMKTSLRSDKCERYYDGQSIIIKTMGSCPLV